jgi:hypothetical protein
MTLCIANLEKRLNNNWSSEEFEECLEELYEHTVYYTELMDIMVEAAKRNAHELIQDDSFRAMISGGGYFFVELLESYILVDSSE